MTISLPLSTIQLALRAGVAGGVATWIAMLIGMQHPIYAFIAAVIVTDLSSAQCQRLGLRRILATVVGAVCGAALSQLLGPGPAAVGIAVVIAMLAGGLLGAGYICGIVVLSTMRRSRGSTRRSVLGKPCSGWSLPGVSALCRS